VGEEVPGAAQAPSLIPAPAPNGPVERGAGARGARCRDCSRSVAISPRGASCAIARHWPRARIPRRNLNGRVGRVRCAGDGFVRGFVRTVAGRSPRRARDTHAHGRRPSPDERLLFRRRMRFARLAASLARCCCSRSGRPALATRWIVEPTGGRPTTFRHDVVRRRRKNYERDAGEGAGPRSRGSPGARLRGTLHW
jgi:hypothetical protein